MNRKLDYPFNLISDVIHDYKVPDNYPVDLFESLNYVILGLTNELQEVLFYRYRCGMSIKACSEAMGVSTVKVNKLISNALLTLSHPLRSRILESGVLGTVMSAFNAGRDEADELRGELAAAEEYIEQLENELKKQRKKANNAEKSEVAKLCLSDSARQCLSRTGVKTLSDIKKLYESGELDSLYVLGRRGYEEIVNLLETSGLVK